MKMTDSNSRTSPRRILNILEEIVIDPDNFTAKKISHNEFKRWYRLTNKILPLLAKIRAYNVKTPILYIMGRQDYMFLRFVKKIT